MTGWCTAVVSPDVWDNPPGDSFFVIIPEPAILGGTSSVIIMLPGKQEKYIV
jgi:hypothetical protein